MPLAAAPGLDDVGRDDVDQDLGVAPPLRIVLEVIRLVVPHEGRIEHQRQEQVVAIVEHEQLADRPLLGGVVDEVLLGAVRADVALERELARDDVLDGDLLVPALAAVAFVAARLGDFLVAAEGTTDGFGGSTGHILNRIRQMTPEAARYARAEGPKTRRGGGAPRNFFFDIALSTF